MKNVKFSRWVNSDFGHSFRNGGETKWPNEFWGQVYGSSQIRPMFKLLGQWQNGPQFFPTDHTRVIKPYEFLCNFTETKQQRERKGMANPNQSMVLRRNQLIVSALCNRLHLDPVSSLLSSIKLNLLTSIWLSLSRSIYFVICHCGNWDGFHLSRPPELICAVMIWKWNWVMFWLNYWSQLLRFSRAITSNYFLRPLPHPSSLRVGVRCPLGILAKGIISFILTTLSYFRIWISTLAIIHQFH